MLDKEIMDGVSGLEKVHEEISECRDRVGKTRKEVFVLGAVKAAEADILQKKNWEESSKRTQAEAKLWQHQTVLHENEKEALANVYEVYEVLKSIKKQNEEDLEEAERIRTTRKRMETLQKSMQECNACLTERLTALEDDSGTRVKAARAVTAKLDGLMAEYTKLYTKPNANGESKGQQNTGARKRAVIKEEFHLLKALAAELDCPSLEGCTADRPRYPTQEEILEADPNKEKKVRAVGTKLEMIKELEATATAVCTVTAEMMILKKKAGARAGQFAVQRSAADGSDQKKELVEAEKKAVERDSKLRDFHLERLVTWVTCNDNTERVKVDEVAKEWEATTQLRNKVEADAVNKIETDWAVVEAKMEQDLVQTEELNHTLKKLGFNEPRKEPEWIKEHQEKAVNKDGPWHTDRELAIETGGGQYEALEGKAIAMLRKEGNLGMIAVIQEAKKLAVQDELKKARRHLQRLREQEEVLEMEKDDLDEQIAGIMAERQTAFPTQTCDIRDIHKAHEKAQTKVVKMEKLRSGKDLVNKQAREFVGFSEDSELVVGPRDSKAKLRMAVAVAQVKTDKILSLNKEEKEKLFDLENQTSQKLMPEDEYMKLKGTVSCEKMSTVIEAFPTLEKLMEAQEEVLQKEKKCRADQRSKFEQSSSSNMKRHKE